MHQITNNIRSGILDCMEKEAGIIGGIGRLGGAMLTPFKGMGRIASWATGISPLGAAATGAFALPVGYSAASRMMPPGGLKRSLFGRSRRASLTEPVKSPQAALF